MAVEFRNRSWFDEKHRDSTLAFECERRLVNVIVDEPQGTANSIPAVWEVTSPDLALVRLHGRNHETWNIKGATAASDRFNYDYSDDKLREFSIRIRDACRNRRADARRVQQPLRGPRSAKCAYAERSSWRRRSAGRAMNVRPRPAHRDRQVERPLFATKPPFLKDIKERHGSSRTRLRHHGIQSRATASSCPLALRAA